jgi:uncharacterized protein YciI
MEFDRFTLVLLLLREDAPTLDEATLDALQDAHLAHLAALHEAGELLAAGPAPGAADRRIRGFFIFRGEPDHVLALEAKDPAVAAGRFATEAYSWLVPHGAMHFSPARFPHSSAEAEGP